VKSFDAVQKLEAQNLLDTCFCDAKSSNVGFLETFPMLFEALEIGNFVLLKNETELQALALWSMLPKANGSYLPNIGGVCVHPKFQGLGLGRKILNLAIEKLASFENIILFSQVPKFYEAIGFQAAANEFFYRIPDNIHAVQKNGKLNFKVFDGFAYCNESRLHMLKDSFLKNGAYAKFRWSESLIQKVLSVPTMKICEVYCDNRMVGFFFLGKGLDFAKTIHTVFLDDPRYLLAAIAYLRSQGFLVEFVFLEPQTSNAISLFETHKFEKLGTGGTMSVFGKLESLGEIVHIPALLAC
jgi:GNAT superfamily N-acetyltransferase